MKNARAIARIDAAVAVACIPLIGLILSLVGSQTRKNGLQAACMLKQRHLGMAVLEYLNDNDGRFMIAPIDPAGNPSPTAPWLDAIQPYITDENDIRCCPATPSPIDGFHRTTFEAWLIPQKPSQSEKAVLRQSSGLFGSYGFNAHLYALPADRINRAYDEDSARSWQTICVKGGGTIPVLADATWVDGRPHHSNSPPPTPEGWSGSEMDVFCINRHHKTVNCLLLDMSVRKVMLWQLWQLKWSRDFNTCNRWTECGGADVNDFPEWMRPDQETTMDKSIWDLCEAGMLDKSLSELLATSPASEPPGEPPESPDVLQTP
jgi:hypothetical protein